MRLSTILYSLTLCLVSLSAQASQINIGDKYSVAGENTSGLCNLINEAPCKEQDSNSPSLENVLSGEVDLASVLTSEIKPDAKLRVLMHLTSDQKYMLVSTEQFPEADANEVIKALEDFLRSGRERTQSRFIQEFIKLPPIYSGRQALEPFLRFDEIYPLHSAIANYYKPELEEPLSITYGFEECERGTNRCMSISDVPVENYRVSQRIARLGMGIAPYLIENLKSENPYLVMKSANAMGRIWPQDSKILTPPLLALLDHPDSEIREQAISSIASLEPIHPEAVISLIGLANQEPVARESFSDRSHGLSQTTTVLEQQPISQFAAFGLGKIATDGALNALKSLVKSDSVAKQAHGIRGLEQYLFRARRDLEKDKSREELRELNNNFSVDLFPEKARDVLAFLEKQQQSLVDENKKLVVNILNRYQSENVSNDVIMALVKDLYSEEQQCEKRDDGTEYCRFNDMTKALYKLKGLGAAAAKSEVLEGLENVLKRGGSQEIEIVYRILEQLAGDIVPPDDLINAMLMQEGFKMDTALAKIASHMPQRQNEIINHLLKHAGSKCSAP